MYRAKFLCGLLMLAGCSFLLAQDDKIQSGPKVGKGWWRTHPAIPKAFECFNVNGPAKGRPHCLVCGFGLSPSVLIFAREPEKDKDETFTELLKQLDETATEFDFRSFSVGVVIVSADGRDSTNNADEKDAAKLIDEAVKRDELVKRLTKRSEGLKHVIVGFVLEAPKEYNLNAKAEMTIILYERMRILETYAYLPGKLEGKDVEKMVKRVREALPLTKKKDADEKAKG